jgi:hypothetical protein
VALPAATPLLPRTWRAAAPPRSAGLRGRSLAPRAAALPAVALPAVALLAVALLAVALLAVALLAVTLPRPVAAGAGSAPPRPAPELLLAAPFAPLPGVLPDARDALRCPGDEAAGGRLAALAAAGFLGPVRGAPSAALVVFAMARHYTPPP